MWDKYAAITAVWVSVCIAYALWHGRRASTRRCVLGLAFLAIAAMSVVGMWALESTGFWASGVAYDWQLMGALMATCVWGILSGVGVMFRPYCAGAGRGRTWPAYFYMAAWGLSGVIMADFIAAALVHGQPLIVRLWSVLLCCAG